MQGSVQEGRMKSPAWVTNKNVMAGITIVGFVGGLKMVWRRG
jgi:hypothetical protein